MGLNVMGQSYFSRVFPDATNRVMLMQVSQPDEARFTEFEKSDLQEVRWRYYLRTQGAFVFLFSTGDDLVIQNTQQKLLNIFESASFKFITMSALDEAINEESRQYSGGRGILPDFFQKNFDETKTYVLLVKVKNPDRDYPILRRLDSSESHVHEYLHPKRAYVVFVHSRERSVVEEVQRRYLEAIPEAIFDNLPGLRELDLISNGIF